MKNILSSLVIVLFFGLFYYISPYFHNLYFSAKIYFQFLNVEIEFRILVAIFLLFYFLFLIVYYVYLKPTEYEGKALVSLKVISKLLFKKSLQIKRINYHEKIAVLSILVKAFWGPLMLLFLMRNIEWILNIGINILNYNYHGILYFFKDHLFWLILSIMLFLDVFIFTLGYWIELDFLNNKIKSVDTTLMGWVVALICYPPFNIVQNNLWWRYSEDLPFNNFDFPYISFVLWVSILILFGIYVWASVALWFKASNMTNRGIVDRWPYKFVRHPAYAAKVGAWFIWTSSYFYSAILQIDIIMLLKILLFMAGIGGIYLLRALTEENHLKKDKDYQKYILKVKYRFIPWVF